MSWICTISSNKTKGEQTMKRVRHRAYIAQQGGGQIREDEQQAIPIYDAITKAVHKWDILGLAKYNDLAYEDTVVWLLQHLPEADDVHSVESLIGQAVTEQQGSPDFSPEQSIMIKFLAEDLWSAWTDYRHRSEQPTFSQVRFRSRMRQHYHPMSTSR
jgi:hypothetical protein